MTMVTVVTVILVMVGVCKSSSPSSRPTRKFRRGAGRPFQRAALLGACRSRRGKAPYPLGERKGAFDASRPKASRVKSAFALLLARVTEPASALHPQAASPPSCFAGGICYQQERKGDTNAKNHQCHGGQGFGEP